MNNYRLYAKLFHKPDSLGVLWGVDNFTVIGQEEAPAEDEGMDMM